MGYRQRRFWRLCGALAAPLAIAGAVTAPGAAGGAAAGCHAAPAGVLPVSPGTSDNELTGVAVLSPCNVWAVGAFSNTGETGNHTLIEHWNGTSWTVVPSPSPSTGENALVSVDAVSATDIWAVGHIRDTGQPGNQPLTEHWDGGAWTVMPSPHLASAQILTGVTAVSSKDAWAVGDFETSANSPRAYVIHWNGTNWVLKRIPPIGPTGTATVLTGVTATSSGNAWAVGSSSPDGVTDSTLILRWNGTKWTSAASPNPGGPAATLHGLFGVAAISSGNAWAAGETDIQAATATGKPRPGRARTIAPALTISGLRRGPAVAGTLVTQSLLLHWNGTKWAAVAGPNLGAGTTAFLAGVAASSATNVWAVGRFTGTDGTGQALAEAIP